MNYGDKAVPTDYSDDNNWLYISSNCDKAVDVFYLYPSSWYGRENEIFCEIDNKIMRNNALTVFSVQGSVFFPHCNIYAPYYRQANPPHIMSLDYEGVRGCISHTPKVDAEAALEYYFENINNGRPFILASHSQGSIVMKELLFGYMKRNPDVYKRMVAAYVIGFGVTSDELKKYPHLKFAEGELDTGVIISYNTDEPVPKTNSVVLLENTLVINPLNWKRSDEYASVEMNLGSLITGGGKLEKRNNFADARINPTRGVLECSSVSTKECFTQPPLNVFHSYDYCFYYMNLRENAGKRIEEYFINNT